MLKTACKHFNEDIQRAKDLRNHGILITEKGVKDDTFRAALMMSVGACDAFFSDAYVDVISRSLRAKQLQPSIEFPERLGRLQVPVTAVIRLSNDGWRWRMAARGLMEDDNVTSIAKIEGLFSPFFPDHGKMLSQATMETWILDPECNTRIVGTTTADYQNADRKQKGNLRKHAKKAMEKRYQSIFQRRHDCIHNCDRPKSGLQRIGPNITKDAINDIEYLVRKCSEALDSRFPEYLKELGFSRAVRSQVLVDSK